MTDNAALLENEMKRCLAELEGLQCGSMKITKTGDWCVEHGADGPGRWGDGPSRERWNDGPSREGWGKSPGKKGRKQAGRDDSSSSESSSEEDNDERKRSRGNSREQRESWPKSQRKKSRSRSRSRRRSKSPKQWALDEWKQRASSRSKSPGKKKKTAEPSARTADETPSLSDWVRKLTGAAADANIRDLIMQTLGSGTFIGRAQEFVRSMFETFLDRVVDQSRGVVADIRTDPSPQQMRRFGLSMIIASEHLKLRGLLAHVREDMLTFVEYFEQTADDGPVTIESSSGGKTKKYLDFMACYAKLADPAYTGHGPSVKMTLRSFGIDIARKMLMMATHVVELMVALEMYRNIQNA